MRWDVTAVAAGAGWITSALLVGAEARGLMQDPRGEALRHLALAVAAAATVVYKIEKGRNLDELIFESGRNVGRMECERDACNTNVIPLHAAVR